MENENKSNNLNNSNLEQTNNGKDGSLDKSKFGALQILTAAQVVTLLVKSDSTFAGPCGY
jgi:hypothetical protein